ncbi:hypothetical protein ACLB2K_072410 [Fragaria x ananassa]
MSRNPSEGEVEPPPVGTQKLPKVFYSQVTCSTCKKNGHNKKTGARRNQQTPMNGQDGLQQQPPMNHEEGIQHQPNVAEPSAHDVQPSSQPPPEPSQSSQ